MKKLYIFLWIIFVFPTLALGAHFGKKATYTACFTPGGQCSQQILNEITGAQDSIKMQEYELTDPDILLALVKAKQRSVDVKVILDKTQIKAATYLAQNKIPVWIDNKPAIAHNKIILLDDNITMVGSYNASDSAQKRNAENLLTIVDRNLYRVYLKNFEKRLNESKKFTV